MPEFLEKLAAMAARCIGEGDVFEIRLAMEGEIGNKELFGVNRVVERKTGKFEVNTDEDPAVRAQTYGGDVEFRDWGSS
jgi:hypothetical protein